MSATSTRSVLVGFTLDVEFSQNFSSGSNATSPAQNQLAVLTTGDNTIDVPEDAVAVTIIKPAENEIELILKGDAADIGIDLHLTDPDSISLRDMTTFILTASDAVTVRLIFT